MKKKLKNKIYKSYNKIINEKNNFVILELKRNNSLKEINEDILNDFNENKKTINKEIRFSNCYLNSLGINSTPIETFINITNMGLLKNQEKIVYNDLKGSLIELKNKRALEKILKSDIRIKETLLILNIFQYENEEKYLNMLKKYDINTKICYTELLSPNEAMILNLDKIKYYEEVKVDDVEDFDNMFNIKLDYVLNIKDNLGFLFYL